jgi:hypothetical protein
MLAMLEQLKLLQHMTPSFYSQPSRLCIKNCMGDQVHPQVLCKKLQDILMLFLEWDYLKRRLVSNNYSFDHL